MTTSFAKLKLKTIPTKIFGNLIADGYTCPKRLVPVVDSVLGQSLGHIPRLIDLLCIPVLLLLLLSQILTNTFHDFHPPRKPKERKTSKRASALPFGDKNHDSTDQGRKISHRSHRLQAFIHFSYGDCWQFYTPKDGIRNVEPCFLFVGYQVTM